MIYYTSGLKFLLCNVFRMSGSVFPTCFCIALPPAILAAGLHWLSDHEFMDHAIPQPIMSQAQAWAGFTSLVGFLIVFRTSQAYSRWWEGCSASFRMRAEFLDAASAVIAFCKSSKAPKAEVVKFKHIFVRVMSLLHASALAEVEEVTDGDGMPSGRYDLLDPEGLSMECLTTLRDAECKVELLFTWVQQMLIENHNTGVLGVPPPILSRVFQELAQGMVQFQNAVKLSCIPFPFVYAQACDFLLIVHWIVSPIVTSQWVETAFWSGSLCFIQVFTLWALNTIATGIENPFGSDAMDLDGSRMQSEMNTWLRSFLLPSMEVVPKLSDEREEEVLGDPDLEDNAKRNSKRLSSSRHFHTLLAQEGKGRTELAMSSCNTLAHTVSDSHSGFYRSDSEEVPVEACQSETPTVRSEGNDWQAAIRKAQQDLMHLETTFVTAVKEEVHAIVTNSPPALKQCSSSASVNTIGSGFKPIMSDTQGVRVPRSPSTLQRDSREVVRTTANHFSPSGRAMVSWDSEPTRSKTKSRRNSRSRTPERPGTPGGAIWEAPPRIRGANARPSLLRSRDDEETTSEI